jgi:pimeloyl-ACP methyl ester carboxylesterase
MTARNSEESSGYVAMPDGGSVYVRQYSPVRPIRGRPVVIVPADGEERTWSQRTMVNLARFLASAGHPVVRFDFRGQGESDGTFEGTDVRSRLEDLAAVAERTRTWAGVAPALVGLRLGATLAVHHGAASGAGEPIVAVEPVDSITSYTGDLLRKNLAHQLVVHKKVLLDRKQLVDQMRSGATVSSNGFLLSRGLLDSLEQLEGTGDRQRCAALSVLRVSRPAGPSEEALPGLPPFWSERPVLGPSPDALFHAVRAKLDDPPAKSWAGPFPLQEVGGEGSRSVCLLADGLRLAATWHPSRADGRSFLFLNPGPNDRSGPHGLYARLATALARRGHPVLRLDASRIAESDGDDQTNQGRAVVDYYREINEGAMVPSALAALDWLADRGHRDTVLFGLCGGAVNAALVACERRDQVGVVVLLGAPVLHLGAGEGVALSDEAVRDELKIMRHQLLSPESLVRFVTFRSDYRAIGRVLAAKARQLPGLWHGSGVSRVEAPLHPQAIVGFLRALQRYAAGGGRLTFVFSEHDRLFELFRRYLPPIALREGQPEAADLRVLKGANHNVTDPAAQERLLEILVSAATEAV